jgi:hypothetical protein
VVELVETSLPLANTGVEPVETSLPLANTVVELVETSLPLAMPQSCRTWASEVDKNLP